MNLTEITENKLNYLPLLLLADDEKFIRTYLDRGRCYVFENQAIAVITDEKNGTCELQNFAVSADKQAQGMGRKFLQALCKLYAGQKMLVRTDEYTAAFYEKCGFTAIKRRKNYFPEKHGHPVIDDKGRELIDNIYLIKEC